MNKRRFKPAFDALELILPLASLAVIHPVAFVDDGGDDDGGGDGGYHDPLPNPEPAPGPNPGDNPPIVYPFLPPSGPSGPGK